MYGVKCPMCGAYMSIVGLSDSAIDYVCKECGFAKMELSDYKGDE